MEFVLCECEAVDQYVLPRSTVRFFGEEKVLCCEFLECLAMQACILVREAALPKYVYACCACAAPG